MLLTAVNQPNYSIQHLEFNFLIGIGNGGFGKDPEHLDAVPLL